MADMPLGDNCRDTDFYKFPHRKKQIWKNNMQKRMVFERAYLHVYVKCIGYVCMHICMYIYTCIHIHAYTHIYIYLTYMHHRYKYIN